MEIHTYEKLWLVASMVLIVGFIATVSYGAVGLGIQMVGDDGGVIDPGSVDSEGPFDEPRVEQVGEDEYDVYVVARAFTFTPDPIVVPEGSTVTFYVTSPDVIHGFQVAGTNVNTMVIPGEIAQITAEFDEPGEYGIICNEYCGAGHHEMEGELIVVPEDEYEGQNAVDNASDIENDTADGGDDP